jgi:hypothetical protein
MSETVVKRGVQWYSIVFLVGYYCSENRHIPTWCDRILHRDTRGSLDSAQMLRTIGVNKIAKLRTEKKQLT